MGYLRKLIRGQGKELGIEQAEIGQRYRDIHWLDKVLDVLLLIAVLSGFAFLIAEIFSSPSETFLSWMLRADVLLIGVLFADLGRTFFRSRHIGNFLKHHWLDLVILAVVIISFSSVLYVGAGRLSKLVREEKLLKNIGVIIRRLI